MYNPDGTWFDEGYGVDPDIPVEQDPGQLSKGTDLQLERAIKEVIQGIENDFEKPDRPPYETR
jgi:tricorn protease